MSPLNSGRCDHDHVIVGFTSISAINTYHYWCWEFESRSGRGVLDTPLCDKVYQSLVTGRWFSPGTPIKLSTTI